MALSILEKQKYDSDYDEMKLHIKPPYVEEVKVLLKDQGVIASTSAIYNVVRGHKKDIDILAAIREHLGLEGKGIKQPLFKRQRLNPPVKQ